MNISTIIMSILLIIQLIATATVTGFNTNTSLNEELLIPVGDIQYHTLEVKTLANRRRLAPFQLCLACKCCTSSTAGNPNSTCVSMPCCFGIDCALPNKPFGICAFVPKTCNCTTCALKN